MTSSKKKILIDHKPTTTFQRHNRLIADTYTNDMKNMLGIIITKFASIKVEVDRAYVSYKRVCIESNITYRIFKIII